MRPLDIVSLFLFAFFGLVIINESTAKLVDINESNHREFNESFQSAVDDVGVYMSLFEAQQVESGVRYSKQKQLSVDMDTLSVFYDNLALKFGIEGDKVEIQNLMMHIPAMAFIRYDGYSLITLEDTSNVSNSGIIYPTIWPQKPYTYVTDSGFILYFTLDNNATLYDPYTNQYIEGTFETLSYVRDLSPINNLDDFREVRQRTITKLIQDDIEGSMNRHLILMKKVGIAIDLYLPGTMEEQSITDVGFLAFIQGYPLPGGELLSSIAFGGGAVQERDPYTGVVRSDGRRIAYQEKCGLPPGTYTILEYLRNDMEAARKGYFVEYCD